MRSRIRRALNVRANGPWIIAAALLVALMVAPFAGAFGDGNSLLRAAAALGRRALLRRLAQRLVDSSAPRHGTSRSTAAECFGYIEVP